MPETRFVVVWPDGAQETCYSPSSVVREHFAAGATYDLKEFVDRSRVALSIANDRVQAKYGTPCSRALGQLAAIERTALRFANVPRVTVAVVRFDD